MIYVDRGEGHKYEVLPGFPWSSTPKQIRRFHACSCSLLISGLEDLSLHYKRGNKSNPVSAVHVGDTKFDAHREQTRTADGCRWDSPAPE
jgi:hypothetical protein